MSRTRFRVNTFSQAGQNGRVFVYELSGCGFESFKISCLNLKIWGLAAKLCVAVLLL